MEELSMVIFRLLSLKGPARHILSVNFFIQYTIKFSKAIFFLYIQTILYSSLVNMPTWGVTKDIKSLDTKSIISNHISGKRTSL